MMSVISGHDFVFEWPRILFCPAHCLFYDEVHVICPLFHVSGTSDFKITIIIKSLKGLAIVCDDTIKLVRCSLVSLKFNGNCYHPRRLTA